MFEKEGKGQQKYQSKENKLNFFKKMQALVYS